MAQPSIGGIQPQVPDRRKFEQLFEAFGNAWEAGKPAGMAAVFTENAVFIPYAFDPPLHGRDAIAHYWRDIPEEQAVIAFRMGEIFTVGTWFAGEFTCSFRRVKTGEWMQISGAVFCETAGDGEKISEMRMYWDRSAVEAP